MNDVATAMMRVRRGVIGILRRREELLLIRRAEGLIKGGYWCFPGGHVERGETSRIAVRRELAEELGIDVRATRRFGSVRVNDSRHVLVVWQVDHLDDELRLNASEIADAKWMTASQIRGLKLGLASNVEVLDLLGI